MKTSGTSGWAGMAAGRFGARGRWIGLLAGAVIGLPAMAQSLERQMQTAIEKAKLGSAHVGVSVVDVESGHELVNITRGGDGDQRFTPASNMKLITSGAATMVLGPNFEFRTEVFIEGDKLIVVGAGDPALADPELLDRMHTSVTAMVDAVAGSVQKAGSMGIREIILNDRVFDREYVHPDWPADQLNRSYCAQVCGLNFHANVLNVYVAPGKGGGEVSARTEPSGSWVSIKKMARTVREGSTEIWLERDREPFAFKLHGTVRAAPDVPVQVTVHEPSMMLGRFLADRLNAAGLGAGGTTPSVRLAGLDEQITTTGSPAAVIRTPLSVALERCNVDSDNLYAECLLKRLGQQQTGQPGSWANGTAVVRTKMKDALGADLASQLVMADGSGLSRNNRVTPEMLTRWISYMAKSDGGEMYIKSMAMAGEEGTLKKRFKGAKLANEVRAKSGYIRNVRSLSGVVTDPSSGKRLAFSVLVDQLPSGTDQRAKDLHEDIVEAVDAHLAQITGRSEAPKATAKSKSKPRSTASADR